ncbi:MAG: hypothetical protein GY928_29385, partial [Colwellia sp.]|nr:hypothetical protein [Colwellia sp.]
MIEELKLLIEFMSGIQADVMPVVYAWLVISIAKWLIVAGILGGGVY